MNTIRFMAWHRTIWTMLGMEEEESFRIWSSHSRYQIIHARHEGRWSLVAGLTDMLLHANPQGYVSLLLCIVVYVYVYVCFVCLFVCLFFFFLCVCKLIPSPQQLTDPELQSHMALHRQLLHSLHNLGQHDIIHYYVKGTC
jgi:hypothetical protein